MRCTTGGKPHAPPCKSVLHSAWRSPRDDSAQARARVCRARRSAFIRHSRRAIHRFTDSPIHRSTAPKPHNAPPTRAPPLPRPSRAFSLHAARLECRAIKPKASSEGHRAMKHDDKHNKPGHPNPSILRLLARVGAAAALSLHADAARTVNVSPQGTVAEVRQAVVKFDEAMVAFGSASTPAPRASRAPIPPPRAATAAGSTRRPGPMTSRTICRPAYAARSRSTIRCARPPATR